MHDINLTREYVFLPKHLSLPVVDVAEDFTLMDFFNMVKDSSEQYPWLLDVLGCIGWFEDLYDEIIQDPSQSDNHAKNIDYIMVEPWINDDYHCNIGDVYTVCSICEVYGVGGEEHYGISACRVNDLKHLKLKFSPIIRKRLIQHPTFLQFAYSVLWELTFFGGPSQRDTKIEEIRETIDGIKEGTIETFPWNPPEDRDPANSYLKLGLGFLESGQIDMDAANLFLKEDKNFQEFRKHLNEVINDLKEIVSDDEDTLDDLLI